jgi:hypothetical protein
MSPHSHSYKHLSGLERRKVIADSYPLKTPADVLYKACLFECIDSIGKADRQVGIMKFLNQMH